MEKESEINGERFRDVWRKSERQMEKELEIYGERVRGKWRKSER